MFVLLHALLMLLLVHSNATFTLFARVGGDDSTSSSSWSVSLLLMPDERLARFSQAEPTLREL